jgi:hypothetical protein
MPLKQARYIHERLHFFDQYCHFQAFTAKISPVETPQNFTDGEQYLQELLNNKGKVELQVTFCSKKDQFCRKKGREECDKAPIYVVPVTDLPRRLAEFKWHMEGESNFPKESRHYTNSFAWIWKYFL